MFHSESDASNRRFNLALLTISVNQLGTVPSSLRAIAPKTGETRTQNWGSLAEGGEMLEKRRQGSHQGLVIESDC